MPNWRFGYTETADDGTIYMTLVLTRFSTWVSMNFKLEMPNNPIKHSRPCLENSVNIPIYSSIPPQNPQNPTLDVNSATSLLQY